MSRLIKRLWEKGHHLMNASIQPSTVESALPILRLFEPGVGASTYGGVSGEALCRPHARLRRHDRWLARGAEN
jgi:hypothetical protein